MNNIYKYIHEEFNSIQESISDLSILQESVNIGIEDESVLNESVGDLVNKFKAVFDNISKAIDNKVISRQKRKENTIRYNGAIKSIGKITIDNSMSVKIHEGSNRKLKLYYQSFDSFIYKFIMKTITNYVKDPVNDDDLLEIYKTPGNDITQSIASQLNSTINSDKFTECSSNECISEIQKYYLGDIVDVKPSINDMVYNLTQAPKLLNMLDTTLAGSEKATLDKYVKQLTDIATKQPNRKGLAATVDVISATMSNKIRINDTLFEIVRTMSEEAYKTLKSLAPELKSINESTIEIPTYEAGKVEETTEAFVYVDAIGTTEKVASNSEVQLEGVGSIIAPADESKVQPLMEGTIKTTTSISANENSLQESAMFDDILTLLETTTSLMDRGMKTLAINESVDYDKYYDFMPLLEAVSDITADNGALADAKKGDTSKLKAQIERIKQYFFSLDPSKRGKVFPGLFKWGTSLLMYLFCTTKVPTIMALAPGVGTYVKLAPLVAALLTTFIERLVVDSVNAPYADELIASTDVRIDKLRALLKEHSDDTKFADIQTGIEELKNLKRHLLKLKAKTEKKQKTVQENAIFENVLMLLESSIELNDRGIKPMVLTESVNYDEYAEYMPLLEAVDALSADGDALKEAKSGKVEKLKAHIKKIEQYFYSLDPEQKGKLFPTVFKIMMGIIFTLLTIKITLATVGLQLVGIIIISSIASVLLMVNTLLHENANIKNVDELIKNVNAKIATVDNLIRTDKDNKNHIKTKSELVALRERMLRLKVKKIINESAGAETLDIPKIDGGNVEETTPSSANVDAIGTTEKVASNSEVQPDGVGSIISEGDVKKVNPITEGAIFDAMWESVGVDTLEIPKIDGGKVEETNPSSANVDAIGTTEKVASNSEVQPEGVGSIIAPADESKVQPLTESALGKKDVTESVIKKEVNQVLKSIKADLGKIKQNADLSGSMVDVGAILKSLHHTNKCEVLRYKPHTGVQIGDCFIPPKYTAPHVYVSASRSGGEVVIKMISKFGKIVPDSVGTTLHEDAGAETISIPKIDGGKVEETSPSSANVDAIGTIEKVASNSEVQPEGVGSVINEGDENKVKPLTEGAIFENVLSLLESSENFINRGMKPMVLSESVDCDSYCEHMSLLEAADEMSLDGTAVKEAKAGNVTRLKANIEKIAQYFFSLDPDKQSKAFPQIVKIFINIYSFIMMDKLQGKAMALVPNSNGKSALGLVLIFVNFKIIKMVNTMITNKVNAPHVDELLAKVDSKIKENESNHSPDAGDVAKSLRDLKEHLLKLKSKTAAKTVNESAGVETLEIPKIDGGKVEETNPSSENVAAIGTTEKVASNSEVQPEGVGSIIAPADESKVQPLTENAIFENVISLLESSEKLSSRGMKPMVLTESVDYNEYYGHMTLLEAVDALAVDKEAVTEAKAGKFGKIKAQLEKIKQYFFSLDPDKKSKIFPVVFRITMSIAASFLIGNAIGANVATTATLMGASNGVGVAISLGLSAVVGVLIPIIDDMIEKRVNAPHADEYIAKVDKQLADLAKKESVTKEGKKYDEADYKKATDNLNRLRTTLVKLKGNKPKASEPASVQETAVFENVLTLLESCDDLIIRGMKPMVLTESVDYEEYYSHMSLLEAVDEMSLDSTAVKEAKAGNTGKLKANVEKIVQYFFSLDPDKQAKAFPRICRVLLNVFVYFKMFNVENAAKPGLGITVLLIFVNVKLIKMANMMIERKVNAPNVDELITKVDARIKENDNNHSKDAGDIAKGLRDLKEKLIQIKGFKDSKPVNESADVNTLDIPKIDAGKVEETNPSSANVDAIGTTEKVASNSEVQPEDVGSIIAPADESKVQPLMESGFSCGI